MTEKNLDIRYEDEYLRVVYKPRGVVIDELGWGYAHRLDKNTCGLLCMAKDEKTLELLQGMLKRHEIKRTYIGIVEGVMQGSGTIDKNLIRSPRNRTLFVTVTGATRGEYLSAHGQSQSVGRNAVTHFTVIENFKNATLVQFNLETGRTHQIRVHCKSMSRPIVGDPEYNPNGKIARGVGQMLESVDIDFTHPVTGKRVHVTADRSPLFCEILKKCAKIV